MLSGSEGGVCVYVTSCAVHYTSAVRLSLCSLLDSSTSMSSTSFPLKQLDLVVVVFTCVQTLYVPASVQGLNWTGISVFKRCSTFLKTGAKV